MKFDMGASTLGDLTKQTSSSSDDLGAQVRQLAVAGEPLEGKFNGAGRGEWDRFKSRVDEVATELSSSLASVLSGIVGMDRAFTQGEQEMVDVTRAAASSADFDAARFGSRA
ncbi:hypothetical protein [Actinomyces weissii]|uniref:WXG100 family type VII secretion target n=1 Tax=Actinomyces weissii TaxID=675090 RepID=A0A7T7S2C8_9ACTO|nr:hypothetical protein [Actinomyces weissii]QQM67545.1 hypothetical protein JG540_01170 [Actinomyces weissii]